MCNLTFFCTDDRVALQPVGELFTKAKWREAIELCKQLMQTRDKRVRHSARLSQLRCVCRAPSERVACLWLVTFRL